MLVGDLVMNVRSLGPDPCQSMLPPGTPINLTAVAGNLTAGTWQVSTTVFNQWGESIDSSEASILLTPGQTIQLTPMLFGAGASVVGVNVYYGLSTSTVRQMESFNFPADFVVGNVTLAGNGVVQTPPVNSSAFLPDSDGSFVSAATMYRWLNDALKAGARMTNGIQDSCGIASVSGMRRYTAPGQWLRFDQCFYDGWELDLGNKAETFRNRNLTANIAISLMVDAQSDTTRIELYWTPSRTSGRTTTFGAAFSTQSNIVIHPPMGWLLQDGFAQLGNEVISYSAQTGSALTNVIRGWNGTRVPATLADGSPVSELNIELTGYRMPAVYGVGDSAMTLGVPPGWEPFLKDYLLGTFREAEQEAQEAEGLKKRAAQNMEAWVKSNKPVAGPRQCRMYGDYGLRGTVPGGLTGPLIIP